MNKVTDSLYIGSADDARRANAKDSVDAIVSLTPFSIGDEKFHAPIQDNGQNTQDQFSETVELALSAVDEHETVLIHCMAGVSRSATIAATVLAEQNNSRFADALQLVEEARPTVNPNPELVEQARMFLGESRSPYLARRTD